MSSLGFITIIWGIVMQFNIELRRWSGELIGFISIGWDIVMQFNIEFQRLSGELIGVDYCHLVGHCNAVQY